MADFIGFVAGITMMGMICSTVTDIIRVQKMPNTIENVVNHDRTFTRPIIVNQIQRQKPIYIDRHSHRNHNKCHNHHNKCHNHHNESHHRHNDCRN